MHVFLLILSATAGGALNAVAGGGTLLTFPALLTVLSERAANMTSTLALLPGTASGFWGFRDQLGGLPNWVWFLTIPSCLGGITGAVLLTQLDEKYFKAVVPWLILLATFLFLMQPYAVAFLKKRMDFNLHEPARGTLVLLMIAQYLIGVYGGYFGAGIGILMLTALGFLGLRDIHQMNALKACLGFIMNGVSAVFFCFSGEIDWTYALVMALASLVGGYFGARLSLLVKPIAIRWFVIATGFTLATVMWLR